MTDAGEGRPDRDDEFAWLNPDNEDEFDLDRPLTASEEEWVRPFVEQFQRNLERLAAERPELEKKWAPLRRRLARRKVPKQWQSWSFLPHGFRVKPDPSFSGDHWQGGEPRHEGATCPICHIPLLLIWDIDCGDPRFPGFFREKLAHLGRLPLYHCCRCYHPSMYKMISPTRIETIRPHGVEDYEPSEFDGELSPFEDYPPVFRRRKISLDPIPADVERLLAEDDDDSAELTEAEVQRIADYLGVKPIGSYIDFFSQFGGVPAAWQGHREIHCPNEQCETQMPWRFDFGVSEHEKRFLLKELAVVCDDSQLEMEMHCAQIAFHICWTCLTIYAEYRCD